MNRLLAFLKAAQVAFRSYEKQSKQTSCTHFWEPARTSVGPARYCKWCEKTEQLTVEMYYAHFGKMPHKWY